MNPHPEQNPQVGEDVIAKLVPYRNKAALLAYYLGLLSVFALFPFLGVVGIGMAVAALVLGWKGRRIAREHPEAKGKVHATVGIVCGALFGLFGAMLQIGLLYGLITG